MRELASHSEDMQTDAEMTSGQFLDKLKQFERERAAYSAQCETLFRGENSNSGSTCASFCCRSLTPAEL